MVQITSLSVERRFLWIFIAYQIFSLLILTYSKNVLYLAVIISLPIIFFLFAFNVKNLLYLLIFYISVFPTVSWGSRYHFFKFFALTPVIVGLMGLIFLFWIYDYINVPYKIIRSNFDRFILALGILTIFSMFVGLTKDYSTFFIFREAIFLLSYLIYFVFRRIFDDHEYIKKFVLFFVLVSLITSIEYILLFFSEAGLSNIFLRRVTTQQPHIILIGYLILLNIVVFEKQKLYRILALLATIPHLLAIFFSQQRALWGAAFLGTLALLFLNGLRSFSRKTWIYIAVTFGIIVLVFVFLLFYIEELTGGSLSLTFFSRISFLLNPRNDISLTLRLAEIQVALKQWMQYPLLGTGLGSSITRFAKMGISDIVDNSFVNYLWKMGIAGLTIYLSIIFTFFKMGFSTIRKMTDFSEKNYLAAILIAFGSLLIVALTNSSVFIYRFNIIWAMLFAIVHQYADHYSGKVR